MATPTHPLSISQRSGMLILTPLGITLGLQACTLTQAGAHPPATEPLWDTEWRLQSIEGQPVIAGSTATLGFYGVGQAGGNGSCNRFFGTLKVDGTRIQFGPIGSTKMACAGEAMAQESRYLTALQKAQRVERQGNILLIHTQGMAQPLRFVSAP